MFTINIQRFTNVNSAVFYTLFYTLRRRLSEEPLANRTFKRT